MIHVHLKPLGNIGQNRRGSNERKDLPYCWNSTFLSLGGCATIQPAQPASHFDAGRTLGQERVQAEIVLSQDLGQVQENFQRAFALPQGGLTRGELPKFWFEQPQPSSRT